MVHDLNVKGNGGNIIFKLDITKAYDNLKWDYLYKILHLFNFNRNFIKLVKNNIETCFFSVIINGKNHCFFSSKHGLRQGDPLSPLFLLLVKIIAEFLTSFQNISGLSISREKSNFITGINVNSNIISRIKNVCGFNQTLLPIKYLGMPLFKGRKKLFLFENFFTIFQKKIT
ncbi:5'-3' exoribonuclease 2 [Dendrobium catenatum]|uniref:5'-3' exoribonuclease 2 n=1 Tax=Dendrobium catenatum TaxID=906689 RepID=A0A2I0VQY6_9ASPA|nr:5'-3' exoribonuclease 2 [Dendrobium catenatum]